MPIGAAIGGGLLAGAGTYFGGKSAQKGYGQAAQMYQPWMETGNNARTTLARLYGTDGQGGSAFGPEAISAFRNTPGYQFARSEGLRGVDFGDAARGTLLSSNNLRGRQEFGTGLADKTFQSYVGELENQANRGFQATGGAANARVGQAGALGGMYKDLGGIGAAMGGGIGGYLQQQNNNDTLMRLYGGMNQGGYGNMGNYGGGTMNTTDFYRMYNQTPQSYGLKGPGIGSM